MRRWASRARRLMDDEEGAVAGWETLPFGLLLFVVGTLVVANAWGVVDAKMVSVAAAREGARAFVESPDAVAAAGAAESAAVAALVSHGRDPQQAVVSVQGAFARCAQITVTVEIGVPVIAVPWVGGLGSGLSATSTHAEIVDPLRSGVPGEANCVEA